MGAASTTCSRLSSTSSVWRDRRCSVSFDRACSPGALAHAKGRGDGLGNQVRVRHGGQRHKPDPVRERVQRLGRGLQRKPGLPGAPRTGEGNRAVIQERPASREGSQLVLPTDERRRLRRKVVRLLIETLQRRELSWQSRSAELEDALGLEEVSQAVPAQILERIANGQGRGQSTRRIRQQDLLPITGPEHARADD